LYKEKEEKTFLPQIELAVIVHKTIEQKDNHRNVTTEVDTNVGRPEVAVHLNVMIELQNLPVYLTKSIPHSCAASFAVKW